MKPIHISKCDFSEKVYFTEIFFKIVKVKCRYFHDFQSICSINVTYSLEQRLRRKINADEEAKLNREIRSVAPTSPNNDVITTRATYGTVNVIFNDDGLEREIGPDGIKPTEHEIVYYKTCLACREQQELCKVRI